MPPLTMPVSSSRSTPNSYSVAVVAMPVVAVEKPVPAVAKPAPPIMLLLVLPSPPAPPREGWVAALQALVVPTQRESSSTYCKKVQP